MEPEDSLPPRHKYAISLKSRRMRWAGHVARMGDRRRAQKILVGKPEAYLHESIIILDGKKSI